MIRTNYSHADNVLALVPSGDWAAGQLMKEDDDGKILTLFRQGSIDKLLALEYHEMLPFLSFLDKYARKVVNGDEMRRWRGQNMDKTLVHKLTPADVAYATLAYETKSAVWTESLLNKRDKTAIKKAEQKYHIKKGARVGKYGDGWTDAGRQYYKELTAEYKRLWDNQPVYATLITQWRRYESANHESTFKKRASEADHGFSDNNDGIDDSDAEIDIPDDDSSPSNNALMIAEESNNFDCENGQEENL